MALSLLTFNTPSFATAIKAGSPCKKVSEIRKVGSTEFICSKKKVWNERSQKKIGLPTSNPHPSLGNLVVSRINSRLPTLPTPNQGVAPKVEWVYPSNSNSNRIKGLQQQHQWLSDFYKDLYLWNGTATAIVDTNPTAVIEKLYSAKCGNEFIESARRLESNVDLIGAGTSFCSGQLVAYFIDRNMSDQKWNNILGSEFGGIIQANAARLGTFRSSPDSDWYSATPNWYAEGSQVLISVLAEAASTRKWNLDLKMHPGMKGDWCAGDTLERNRCSDLIGAVATELAIALYGWEAPLTLLKYLEPNIDQVKLFEAGFPDSFKQFNSWTVAYYQYLRSGTQLPNDLVQRLRN